MSARVQTAVTFAVVTCALACGCGDSQGPAPTGSAAASGGVAAALGGAADLAGAGGSVATSSVGGVGGSSGGGGNAGAQSSGGAVSGGGAGGGSDGAGAGTGGMPGTSGASPGGSGSSAGGGSGDGWVPIFNGKDLTNWYPKITGFPYKTDPYETFTVKSGVIKVGYEKYPSGRFDNHFGLLYYDKLLTNYRVRVEYHFLEPQAASPPGWGKNNSGLMLFGLDPTKVQGEPSFPPLLEIQLLGNPSSGGDTNPNLCKPGGYTVALVNGHPPGNDCDKSTLPAPPPPPAAWVTVEAEVHVNGDTKVYQYPNTTTPALTFSGPQTSGGQPLTNGYISLQSESQPCEFRKVELMELPD